MTQILGQPCEYQVAVSNANVAETPEGAATEEEKATKPAEKPKKGGDIGGAEEGAGAEAVDEAPPPR